MKKILGALLKIMAEVLEKASVKIKSIEEKPAVLNRISSSKYNKKIEDANQKKKKEIISCIENPIRDVIDLMEFPFVSLSKNRINPIIYESEDGTQKVVISGHRGHFLASIYDWDIILVAAGRIQETLNKSEIPSHTITIPRHELLKALHKGSGKKQQEDLEKSLARLQLTGIETTVNNKDFKYKAGFGFIDRWGYLERKNNREIRIITITLSPWLYELCCAQGNLLKPNASYFDITSGLKKFLYRTARKHVGLNREGWEFSLEKLYAKSGSEGNIRKFKSKLKAAVIENSLPDYIMKWVDKNGKIFVEFKKRHLIAEIDIVIEKYERNEDKSITSLPSTT